MKPTVRVWRTGSSNKLMDGCDELLIEVDGMSVEQDKSEVVLIMYIETEYSDTSANEDNSFRNHIR
jgi:hypothetical protein